jgi:uncharacterized protein
MELLPHTYRIIYNNQDITNDVTDHLVSLSYTDKVSDEADELELVLEDTDGMWQNAWYPEKLAKITAEIILIDQVLKCGDFCIDEPEFSFGSGGDQVTIRAVSSFFTTKLRTKRSSAHENKTLAEIARTVAARHNLKILGKIPDLSIGRVTQRDKNDLAFLQGLAIKYGYAFSVKGGVMVFTDLETLERSNSIASIDKSDLIECSITDKSSEIYKNANVKFHNPENKELVEYNGESDSDSENADSLEIRERAENREQAERIAHAKLRLKNTIQQSGSMTVQGNPLLISGVNFELTGCGRLSGIYQITKSVHTISRDDGYKTQLEIKRIGKVDETKYISSKAAKSTPKINTSTKSVRQKV